MNYRKIKVSLVEAKDRFYRELLVDEEVDVQLLGIIIGTALKAEFLGNFSIIDGNDEYISTQDERIDQGQYLPGDEYFFTDLSDKFLFVYENNDKWVFDCEVYKEIIESEEELPCIILDGKGQGIWEDWKDNLIKYINGEIKDLTIHEEGPWNFENTSYLDFDNSFDIEEENENYYDIFQENLGYIFKDNELTSLIEKARFEGPYKNVHQNVSFFAYKAVFELIEKNKGIAKIFRKIKKEGDEEYAYAKMVVAYIENYCDLMKNKQFDEKKFLDILKEI